MPVWGWAVIGLLAAAAVGSTVGLGVVLARRDDSKPVEEKPANENAKLNSLETEISKLEEDLKVATARLDEGQKGRGARKRLPPDKTFTDPLYGIVKVVKNLDEHREHPRTASGFFIGDQNWIVTTHRICENAKSLKIVTCNSANGGAGTTYDVEGMIAGNEKLDLAIIKPKVEGAIPGVKSLKLADDPQPVTGMTIYALGSPGKHVHVVTRGMITRVVDGAKLAEEMKDAEGRHEFDLPLRDPSSGTSYIEFDARTYPGAYGGPLLNDNLEVIGVQSLLAIMTLNDGYTTTQTYACALHVKHAAELIKSCDGTVKAYPTVPDDEPKRKLQLGPGGKKKPKSKEKEKEKEKDADGDEKEEEKPKEDEGADEGSDDEKKDKEKAKSDEDSEEASTDEAIADDELADKIKELAEECGKFSWTPTSKAEYNKLSKLAKGISRAKEMMKNKDGEEEVRKEADGAADEVLKTLEENPWQTEENAGKLNAQAPAKPTANAGAFVIGEVKGAFKPKADAKGCFLVLQLVGTSKKVVVQVKNEPDDFPQDSKWIVLGTYASQQAGFKLPSAEKRETAPVIIPWPMISLEF
jgi:S1-C subfamily serine protease